MNSGNKSGWLNAKNFIFLVLGIALIYWMVSILVDSRFQDLELSTRVKISDQETLLVAIAETTARNGADIITESIVMDCSVDERERFDTLLSHLNDGLPHTELVELERLFGRCGGFYSERKSVMVARLSREIEIYEDYVDQLGIITNKDQSLEFDVADWNALAEQEKTQSALFTRLVSLQDRIISNLMDGKIASSDEIVGILVEVKSVQEGLLESKQISTSIKTKLVSL